MSWDIDLVDNEGNVFSAPRHTDGGTYVIGGTDQASLNVTYNYGKHFNFGQLKDRMASERLTSYVMPSRSWVLYVTILGTVRDDNYWAATPGNAGAAVKRLLSFALLHPTGKWRVT